MAEPFTVQSSQKSVKQPSYTVIEEAPDFDVSVFKQLDFSSAELTALPYIQLDLEGLACFAGVDQQFESLGVTFSNAIALHPSNPAYPTQSGKTTVLMGAPKSGWLEASFRSPVRFVSGSVTSSRRTVLAAFDANNTQLVQIESLGANLASADSEPPPNTELSLRANDIHRIVFYSFNGQLTLSEFKFGF
jgi:hypothetical protein